MDEDLSIDEFDDIAISKDEVMISSLCFAIYDAKEPKFVGTEDILDNMFIVFHSVILLALWTIVIVLSLTTNILANL